jgi:hypothetical protein
MPDPEPKPKPEGDKGPQPAIDADAIKAAVGEAVGAALADWTPPEPRSAEPQRPQPQPNDDPLADLIGSKVNPALRSMGYEIADAKDAAMFYVEHPEALKHKKALEDAFNTLKAQGTPMSRVAVFDWYKGKNFDTFRKEANEEAALAAEKAKEAGDTGPGVSRRREVASKDPHTMSDEELSKALEGVAF